VSAPAPAYLVAGDDDHLVQRASERLLKQLGRDLPDLDVEHVDVATAEHLPDMRTASLFGGTRCVVLRNASSLSGTLAKEVTAYLEQPSGDTVLVLVARGTGRIRSIAARVGEIGERIDVTTPPPWDERQWADLVSAELSRLGRKAEPAAVHAIVERAGTDPSMIAVRAGQVAAATPAEARITVEDVERVVEGVGNRGAFAVADAVTERDPVTAVVALRGALDAGEEPVALLGAIAFRLRQLLQIRGGATASEAKMSAGQHRRLERFAQQFRPGELAWCHDRAARADLELKGSDLPASLVLEVAVIELATSRDVGAPWAPSR
jgi:DNA polymerase III subunit delta